MKKLLLYVKLACNNNKWDIKYIQILSAPGEGATE